MVKKVLKDKLLRPIIIDNMKEIQVDDINIKRKALFLTEEEIESISTSNKTEESIYDEILRD